MILEQHMVTGGTLARLYEERKLQPQNILVRVP